MTVEQGIEIEDRAQPESGHTAHAGEVAIPASLAPPRLQQSLPDFAADLVEAFPVGTPHQQQIGLAILPVEERNADVYVAKGIDAASKHAHVHFGELHEGHCRRANQRVRGGNQDAAVAVPFAQKRL